MIKNKFQIISPSATLRKDFKSSIIDTQLLFGETFLIKEIKRDWVYGVNCSDNYKGWVKKKNLGILPEFNFIIASPRVVLTTKPNVKSNFIQYLPMGSRVCGEKIEKNWLKIYLSDKHNFKFGYISSKKIIYKTQSLKDWVQVAESLVGSPYRWGGRDTLGLDCSALIQLSLIFRNIYIPRDTNDQINHFKTSSKFSVYSKNEFKLKHLLRGDLIYWKGHIGILINKKEVLHASATHGCVLVEPLDIVINRIKINHIIIRLN